MFTFSLLYFLLSIASIILFHIKFKKNAFWLIGIFLFEVGAFINGDSVFVAFLSIVYALMLLFLGRSDRFLYGLALIFAVAASTSDRELMPFGAGLILIIAMAMLIYGLASKSVVTHGIKPKTAPEEPRATPEEDDEDQEELSI